MAGFRRLSCGIALAVAFGGGSHAAVCTVTDARVLVRNFDLEGQLPIAGFAIPVEIAESSGSFRMDFTDFPLTHFSIVGVDSTFDLPPQGFDGSLDASGNVTIPDVPLGFVTNATNPPTAVGTVAALTTGISAVSVSGRDYVAAGATLDFQTGTLRLAGHGIVLDAPLAGMPVTTGLSLTCTLDPLPTQTNLPPGPTLGKSSGRGKFRKPAKDGSLVGDRLTLATTFESDTPLDLTALDLFVRIPGEIETPPTGDPVDHTVLVRVPAGSFQRKGKKLVASDEDGSVVRLVSGRKRTSDESAPVSGTVVAKETKHGLAIKLTQSGADLSGVLTGASQVLVVVGQLSATDDTTVSESKKGIAIK
jgi:hypothetical protein